MNFFTAGQLTALKETIPKNQLISNKIFTEIS
jgi:hypothetical protein